MNKTVKIIIAVVIAIVAVVAILVGVFAFGNSKPKSNLTINSAEDLTALIDQIYAGISIEMPMVMSQQIESTDAEMVQMYTGLDNGENIDYLVVSEPMMSAQAYSLVLLKVKDGADADSIAKTMNENINTRKWICVTAESVYSAASGNVVCLVMSNEATAKTVFESFKTLAGGIGEENVRVEAEPELPEDMLMDQPAAM